MYVYKVEPNEFDITHLIIAIQRGDDGADMRLIDALNEGLDRLVKHFGKKSKAIWNNDREDLRSAGQMAVLEKSRNANTEVLQHGGSYLKRAWGDMMTYIREELGRGMTGDFGKDFPEWEEFPEEMPVASKDDYVAMVDARDLLTHIAKDQTDIDIMTARANGEPTGLNERTERHRVQGLRERLAAELEKIEGFAAPTLAT